MAVAGVPAVVAGIYLRKSATAYQPEAFSAAIGGLLALAGLLPAGYAIVLSRATIRLDQGRFLRRNLHAVLVVLIGAAIVAGLVISFAGLSLGEAGPWQLLLGVSAALTLTVAFWSPLLIVNLLNQTTAASTTAYAVREIIRCEGAQDGGKVTSLTKDLRDIGLEEWKKGDRRALHERLRGLLTVVSEVAPDGPAVRNAGGSQSASRIERTAAEQAQDEFIFISESVVKDRDHAQFALSLIGDNIGLDNAEMVICSIWAAAAERGASRHVKKKAAEILMKRHKYLASIDDHREQTQQKINWEISLDTLRNAVVASSDAVSVRMAIEAWTSEHVFPMQSSRNWLEFLSVDEGLGYAHYYSLFRDQLFSIISEDDPQQVAKDVCNHRNATSLIRDLVSDSFRASNGGRVLVQLIEQLADRPEELKRVGDEFVSAVMQANEVFHPSWFDSELASSLAKVVSRPIEQADPSTRLGADTLSGLAAIVSSAIIGLRSANVAVDSRLALYDQLQRVRGHLDAKWPPLFVAAEWRLALVRSLVADIEILAIATTPAATSVSCASLLGVALSGLSEIDRQRAGSGVEEQNAKWCSEIVLSDAALEKIGSCAWLDLPLESLMWTCALETVPGDSEQACEKGRRCAQAIVNASLAQTEDLSLHQRVLKCFESSDSVQLRKLRPLCRRLAERGSTWNSALQAWWLYYLDRSQSFGYGDADLEEELDYFLSSNGFDLLIGDSGRTSWSNGALEPLSETVLNYFDRSNGLPPHLSAPVSQLLMAVLPRELPGRPALVRRVVELEVIRHIGPHIPAVHSKDLQRQIDALLVHE